MCHCTVPRCTMWFHDQAKQIQTIYAQAKTPNHDQQLPQLRGNLGQLCPVRNGQTKDRHRINIETQVVRLKGWKTLQWLSYYRIVSGLWYYAHLKISKRHYLFPTCSMCISPPIPGPRYGASAFCTVGSKALIFMMSCSASNKKDGKDTSIRRVRNFMHFFFSKWKLRFKIAFVTDRFANWSKWLSAPAVPV